MHLGFSYSGLILLLMLFIPNIIWTKHLPRNYEKYSTNENKILLAFERTGEFLVTCLLLIFKDLDPHGMDLWLILFCAAFFLMILYEIFWIRYFQSPKTMMDYYSSLLGIPVAGATLPVIAVFLLSIYSRNPLLGLSSVILGIGHIGIHLTHKKEAEAEGEITDQT